MSWYTGACTLTGNVHVHTHRQTHTQMLIHKQNIYFLRVLSLSNSYDSWLSSSDVEGEVEEPPHSEKPWRVSIAAHIKNKKNPQCNKTVCMLNYITSSNNMHCIIILHFTK